MTAGKLPPRKRPKVKKTCPVCKGKGKVTLGFGGTRKMEPRPKKCGSCNGKGWELVQT
jgi:DnaJ-class molecular chaperone